MNAIDLIDSFTEFKELKNIDRVTMMRIVEDVFRTTLKRKYGSDDNVDVIINPDKGDLEIWLSREIVQDSELEDEGTQIKLSEALKIEPDFEIGEEVSQEIKVEDFGRRNILALRQNLVAKVLELEKDGIYQKYKDEYNAVSLDQILTMIKDGHSIGGHTFDHPNLALLNEDKISKQISLSANKLEYMIRSELIFFAFPFGSLESINYKSFLVAKKKI